MTQHNAALSYRRFYDQVLSEISAGKIEQGINVLVGMLDAAHFQGAVFDEARAALDGHLLHQLLLRDPLCAHAAACPGDSVGLAALLARPDDNMGTGSTSQKLFAVSKSQPIARALLNRKTNVARLIARAAKDGLLVGDGTEGATARGRQYDLICASGLAERFWGKPLVEALAHHRACLSDRGRIVLCAALSDHLGAGWRIACLNWTPCTHDERSLTEVAAAAGLSARTYRDEADCFVWAELRPN